jgi:hypothetical protein
MWVRSERVHWLDYLMKKIRSLLQHEIVWTSGVALLAIVAAPAIVVLVLKALGWVHGASLHTWLLDVGQNMGSDGGQKLGQRRERLGQRRERFGQGWQRLWLWEWSQPARFANFPYHAHLHTHGWKPDRSAVCP